MTTAPGEDFYSRIPVFRGFGSLMNPDLYAPLPDDWHVGLADIVNSTGAIAASRYKSVNMAGAAVIAAVANALQGREFPFVFGGDGASFAVSADDLDLARDALAATAAWVADDLDLVMRVALVSVAQIRVHGFDVFVARFGPSANVSYAMFSGGGLHWADAAMKRGEFAVTKAPPGTQPNLDGLTCRFEEIPASRGVILSLLVMPTAEVTAPTFRRAVEEVIALAERSPDSGRPVPSGGPRLRWPPAGISLEASAARGGWPIFRRIIVLAKTLFSSFLFRTGQGAGGFVPEVYMKQLVENSDFRKFDDGLRMVIDCTPQLVEAIRGRLVAAAAKGAVHYGMHEQDAAMITCFTPSAARSDHVHFIDGAHGGYALAATALKSQAASVA